MNLRKLSLKGFILGFIVFSSVLIATGCEEENPNAVVASEEQKILDLTQQLEQKNKEIEKLKQKIDQVEQEKTTLKEEITYNQAFAQKVMGLLSEEEKQKAIQSEWQYSLQLDDADVGQLMLAQEENAVSNQNLALVVDKKSFQLSLVERKPAYLVLPEATISSERVKGNLSELITVIEEDGNVEKASYEVNTTQEGLSSGVTYQFKDIKDNTTIRLNIADELQKRLELKSNQLIIHVQSVQSTTESNSN